MVQDVKERIRQLKASARQDPEYARLCKLGLVLEGEFELALVDLPEGVQDAVWRYLFHCEAQSERLLELALAEKSPEH